MTIVKKYVKKPIEVEAVQLTLENYTTQYNCKVVGNWHENPELRSKCR